MGVELKPDHERLNRLGGAIALAHPPGGSGNPDEPADPSHRTNNIRYGVQPVCECGGTENATLVDLIRSGR